MSARDEEVGCTIAACFLLALFLYLAMQVIVLLFNSIDGMLLSGEPALQIFAIGLIVCVVYIVCRILEKYLIPEPVRLNLECEVRKEMEKKIESCQWTVEDFIDLSIHNQDRKCATCQHIPMWLQRLTRDWTEAERKAAIRIWKEDPEDVDAIDLRHLKESGWLTRCKRY